MLETRNKTLTKKNLKINWLRPTVRLLAFLKNYKSRFFKDPLHAVHFVTRRNSQGGYIIFTTF